MFPQCSILCLQATLPSVPVFVEANGLYDVEYRILFACRDANIYLIKRGYASGRFCVQLNSHAVGLARIGSNIYVSCMDQSLSIYTSKGNRIWTMTQAAPIVAMEAIFLERHGIHLVAVSLANKTIVFYNVISVGYANGYEINTFICFRIASVWTFCTQTTSLWP